MICLYYSSSILVLPFLLCFLRACLLVLLIISLLELGAVLTFTKYLNFDALLMFGESVYFLYILFFLIAGTCTGIKLDVGVLFCVGTLFYTSCKLTYFSFFWFEGFGDAIMVCKIVILGIVFSLA